MKVETVRPGGHDTWVAGLVGVRSELFRKVTLTSQQIQSLTIIDSAHTNDGDGRLLKLARVRFLLADDAVERQRSLSLQGVERLTSVHILPHPERDAPEVRRLQPNSETEAAAVSVVIEHEQALGRQVYDVHDKNLGYDITSLDLNSGELRLIEVKGLSASTGTVLITPNEQRVAEDRPDCYWLYIVTNCAGTPILQEPIKDPARFPWHEVSKIQHYWLEVNAMTKPMQIREDPPDFKGAKR
jgi:hypothetical protein